MSPELEAIATECVVNSAVAIQTVNYNQIGPANATGNLAANIATVPNEYSLFDVVAINSAAPYVRTLIDGRKPGKGIPSPSTTILPWMDAKRIALDQNPKKRLSIAWAIAIKIKKEGNVVTRLGLAPTPLFDGMIATATAQISKEIVRTVTAVWH
jgi:hypothetical protein